MFVLSELKSLIRLLPKGFDRTLQEQLTDEINRKLANKVLLNVGLCLCLYDIVEIGESFIFPGDGASHTRVRFRMLVFRPELEEVLVGKIKSCSKEGVHVTLEFFDDILIPADCLQHPARYDDNESVWIWEYPLEEDEHKDFFMDPGERIRFRVCSESFVDTGPSKAKTGESDGLDEMKVSPFSLRGTINESGLGLLSWWNYRREGMSKLQPILRFSCRYLARRNVVSVANISGSSGSNSLSKQTDAFDLMKPSLTGLMEDIHCQLESDLVLETELGELSRYYFDGGGKLLRPCIAMCVGHMANTHQASQDQDIIRKQRDVSMVAEMIHTASLVHDDILDHAETRRGKKSINTQWDIRRSTMAGDFILGVSSRILAQIAEPEVVVILSQVLADLVQGEFQQLENKDDESERFEHYLSKSFNKTASLMAYSCRANAVLAGVDQQLVEDAFQYGRNVGVAFQLVDDLLDFTVSADQLGKPAAADLKLGLATAPVLFAAEKFPELNTMIGRRFSEAGDVETAFQLVRESGGLQETKNLARRRCETAVASLESFVSSPYKLALVELCDKVINRIK